MTSLYVNILRGGIVTTLISYFAAVTKTGMWMLLTIKQNTLEDAHHETRDTEQRPNGH